MNFAFPGTCGLNAECRVAIHRAVCTCLNGYQGDPFRRCQPIPPPTEPVIEDKDNCIPSPCGPYSTCRNLGPRPVCECQRGYFGKPPNCQPECLKNSDCALNKACINQKCQDPCPGVCGANALCQVVSHNPICSCPPGYNGDPFNYCQKIPSKRMLFFYYIDLVFLYYVINLEIVCECCNLHYIGRSIIFFLNLSQFFKNIFSLGSITHYIVLTKITENSLIGF